MYFTDIILTIKSVALISLLNSLGFLGYTGLASTDDSRCSLECSRFAILAISTFDNHIAEEVK